MDSDVFAMALIGAKAQNAPFDLSQFAPAQIPPPFLPLLPAQVSLKTRPGTHQEKKAGYPATVTSQICLEGWIGWRWYWHDVMGVDATLTMRA